MKPQTTTSKKAKPRAARVKRAPKHTPHTRFDRILTAYGHLERALLDHAWGIGEYDRKVLSELHDRLKVHLTK